eukprot:SAG31_NODE_1252_length_9108_cov_24.066711_5_plen_53_part_00
MPAAMHYASVSCAGPSSSIRVCQVSAIDRARARGYAYRAGTIMRTTSVNLNI